MWMPNGFGKRDSKAVRQQKNLPVGRFFRGAANGNRTRNRGTTNPCDNRFTMAAMVARVGLEPTTLRLELSCSIQLSYQAR